jgi:diguanylate cyclase (GGDEF)-like protein
MQNNLRGSDLLARLGGDEFAICFFSSQSAQFIERLEEIQQYFVDNPLEMEGRLVSCYFSYGIAYCPEDGESYSILLKKADLEMYKIKADIKKRILKNDLHDLR